MAMRDRIMWTGTRRIAWAAVAFACGAAEVKAQNVGYRVRQAHNTAAPQRTAPQQPRTTGAYAAPPALAAGAKTAAGRHPIRPRPVATSWSLAGLRQALGAFHLDMGRLPNASEGLSALLKAPPGAVNWRGPYMTIVSGRAPFADPWGNSYRYIPTSYGGRGGFIIKSDGPDGLPETADDLSISG